MTQAAVLGDIVGSTFEREPSWTPYFELFRKNAHYTDDSVATRAVALILSQISTAATVNESDQTQGGPSLADRVTMAVRDPGWSAQAALMLKAHCLPFLNRGFGGIFYQWLTAATLAPYGSNGNGALMRISPVAAWAVRHGLGVDVAAEVARKITDLTHNHPHAQEAVDIYVRLLHGLFEQREKVLARAPALSPTPEDAKALEVWLSNAIRAALELGLEDRLGTTLRSVQEYRVMFHHQFDVSARTSLLVVLSTIMEHIHEAEMSEEARDPIMGLFRNQDHGYGAFEQLLRRVITAGGDSDTLAAIIGPFAQGLYGLDPMLLQQPLLWDTARFEDDAEEQHRTPEAFYFSGPLAAGFLTPIRDCEPASLQVANRETILAPQDLT